jgi:hypothetical protein
MFTQLLPSNGNFSGANIFAEHICNNAPSLRLLVPCSLSASLLYQFTGTELPEVAGTPTVPARKPLPFGWWSTPPQRPVVYFPQPDGKTDCSLHDFQSEGFIKCLLASQTYLLSPASSFDPVAERLARSPTTMSLARCRNFMEGQTSAGGGRLFRTHYCPGPVAPYGQTLIPRSVFSFYDRLA